MGKDIDYLAATADSAVLFHLGFVASPIDLQVMFRSERFEQTLAGSRASYKARQFRCR